MEPRGETSRSYPAMTIDALRNRTRSRIGKIRLCLAALLVVTAVASGSPSEAEMPVEDSACPTSVIPAGQLLLTAGLDGEWENPAVVDQGNGGLLSGSLIGSSGVPGAFLCVFSRVQSRDESSLLGIAVTDPNGDYRFAVPPGPSRTFTVLLRSPDGRLSTEAVLKTRVRPSLRAQPDRIQGDGFVRFSGRIPGPDNRPVTVVLQASALHGSRWLDFRHASTQLGGRFSMRYFFRQTERPITYLIRAQVLGAPGYPYEAGISREIRLRALP